MLRINLLPPYVYDEKKKKGIAAAWGLGALACIAACTFGYMQVQAAQKEADERKTTAENFQQQYQSKETAITNEKQRVARIQERQTFVANAQQYNDGWPKAYRTVRDVTSPDVILREVSIAGSPANTVNMVAYAPSEAAAVRWLMYLRTQDKTIDRVEFQLPTRGYLTDNPGGAGGGGMGGAMMGGMPPGMGGSSSMMAMMMGGGGGGRRGMAPMGGGGARPGGGANSQNVGPTELEGRPGLGFVAMAVLKEPVAKGIPAPSWPAGSGGGAGGAGGMRMPGGAGMPPMGGAPMGTPGGSMGGMSGGSGGGGSKGAE